MNSFKSDTQKNMYNTLAIVKLASLFFCAILFYMQIPSLSKPISTYAIGYFTPNAIGIALATITLIYLSWSFFYINILQLKYNNIIAIIENILFITLFSSCVLISNTYQSQCKFLFLLVIITSSIQMGLKQGLFVSIISSIIVLTIDIIFAPNLGVNLFFENDLTLTGVFIITAWFLGHYVKIEKNTINQKNSELKRLTKELIIKDKQRKYVEEVILTNESCYNLLIENSHDAVFIHRNNKLIFANESAIKLLGIDSRDNLIGRSILDITPTNDKENIRKKLAFIYKEKLNKLLFEEQVIKGNGEIIVAQNTSAYFLYEGKPTILSILHDITSLIQVEKLEKDVEKNKGLLSDSLEYNKVITEFFSNVSHELKTPLNVIFSAVQVLNLHGNDEKHDEYLKIIKQNCYRLMRLINNLLDITRLDAGFIKLHPGNYNIVSIVEEITLSVVTFAEIRGINIIFDTNIEEKIMAFDQDKMERIILNLLSNAIKFTNRGGEIYVNMVEDKTSMIISVKDSGVGIPEDKIKLIFDRFGQVDKTLRRNREGTGIGLSLVKSLVELHEGTIEVKSTLGIGSEFILNIPIKTIKDSPPSDNMQIETNMESTNMEFSDIYF